MKTLNTDRLILRKWNKDDASDLYEYAKSKLVGPMAGWKPHENIDESKKIIESFIKNDETWAIYFKEDKKIIGSVGLHPDRKRILDKSKTAMLGYVLSEKYWGKGIMLEACSEILRFSFEELGLEFLSLFHYPFNKQSRRIAEKLGFKYEGTIKNATTVYDGQVYDDVCYSLTKEEWRIHQLSKNMSSVNKKLVENVKFRNYKLLSDFDKISSFLRENYNEIDYNGYLLQPFFEYAHTHPMFNYKASHNMGIWESNEKIIGVACYEMDMGECFILTNYNFIFLLSEILDYAQENLSVFHEGEKRLRVWTTDTQKEHIEILKKRNYKNIYSEPVTIFDYTNDFPTLKLPDGFESISLDDENNLKEIHNCMWKGFDHGDMPDKDLDSRKLMQSGPNFRHDLATIIKTPEGTYAAYAGMWLERENGYAYLEPLCTIPKYRKMGLGSFALVNSMEKTKKLGARYCFGGTSDFYRKLGFKTVCNRLLWEIMLE